MPVPSFLPGKDQSLRSTWVPWLPQAKPPLPSHGPGAFRDGGAILRERHPCMPRMTSPRFPTRDRKGRKKPPWASYPYLEAKRTKNPETWQRYSASPLPQIPEVLLESISAICHLVTVPLWDLALFFSTVFNFSSGHFSQPLWFHLGPSIWAIVEYFLTVAKLPVLAPKLQIFPMMYFSLLHIFT